MAAGTIKSTVTILSGASVSDAIPCAGGGQLVAVYLPSAWTAAALSFDGSFDGVTFFPVWTSAGELATAALPTTGAVVVFKFDEMMALTWLKIHSGTHGSAVTQAADRVLTCAFRAFS